MSPQISRIYTILKDSQWHCPIEWQYADGHCKRITDLNRLLYKDGLEIKSAICDCGRHTSKILKRKIVEIENPVLKSFQEEYSKRHSIPKQQILSF